MNLLKSRNVALLWTGRLISLLGDWMLDIALPVWVYQLTGSASALGIMVAIQQVPGVLLTPVAGVLVDRWSRKSVMVVTYLLLGLAILPLFAVRTAAHIPIIYIVGFLNGVLGSFLLPARNALLPSIVEREHLMQANSLFDVMQQALMLVGPALGAAVLTWAGVHVSLVLDVASFFVGALFIAAIHLPSGLHLAEAPESRAKSIWQEFQAGLNIIRSVRVLWSTLIVWSILIFAGGAVAAVLVAFVGEALNGDEATYGYLLSAQGFGMFIGAALMMTAGKRVRPIPLITGGLFAFGLVFLIGANVSSVALAAILVCVLGILMAAVAISQTTLTQEATPDAFRGRVVSANDAVASLMMLLGALIGGFLADQAGVRAVFNGAAILSLLAALFAFVLLRPLHVMEPKRVSQPIES
jgi:MFS family permease